jgi:Domain of unknown function (DUF4372)/Transposase DDE domain
MDFLPLPIFGNCVAKNRGDFRVKKFSCLDRFLCMGFAQITWWESLLDIRGCLRSQSKKLYHTGIRGKVSRLTLAEAKESREWRILCRACPSPYLWGQRPLQHRFVSRRFGRKLVFLTNNFALPELTIAQLNRSRWKVELFFKWIMQHHKIKTFFWTSENAVKT